MNNKQCEGMTHTTPNFYCVSNGELKATTTNDSGREYQVKKYWKCLCSFQDFSLLLPNRFSLTIVLLDFIIFHVKREGKN